MAKVMIFSRFNRPPCVSPPVGDGTAPVFEKRIVDGRCRLVQTGVTNLYDFVQASKEEVLIYNIIERFNRGDVNALNQRVGQYLDVVGLPSTLAEAQQLMIDVQNKFDHLDAEVKAKFDNSVSVYINSISKSSPDQLREIFGITKQAVENHKKEGELNVTE